MYKKFTSERSRVPYRQLDFFPENHIYSFWLNMNSKINDDSHLGRDTSWWDNPGAVFVDLENRKYGWYMTF